MDVHFSSKTDLWETPQDTFDALAAEFGPFDLDVCATLVGNQKQHIAEKPESVMSWVLGVTPAGCTILDPFAGSGTTGWAAKLSGCKAVLIEREEKYCEIAARRMGQEVLAL